MKDSCFVYESWQGFGWSVDGWRTCSPVRYWLESEEWERFVEMKMIRNRERIIRMKCSLFILVLLIMVGEGDYLMFLLVGID